MSKFSCSVFVSAIFFIISTSQAYSDDLQSADTLASERLASESLASEESEVLRLDESDEFERVACWQYDGRPRMCQNIYGCSYNFRTQRCRERLGPGSIYFTCYARDYGFEEHWRAHRGQGRSQWQARQSALYECRRHHNNCYIDRCTRN